MGRNFTRSSTGSHARIWTIGVVIDNCTLCSVDARGYLRPRATSRPGLVILSVRSNLAVFPPRSQSITYPRKNGRVEHSHLHLPLSSSFVTPLIVTSKFKPLRSSLHSLFARDDSNHQPSSLLGVQDTPIDLHFVHCDGAEVDIG